MADWKRVSHWEMKELGTTSLQSTKDQGTIVNI